MSVGAETIQNVCPKNQATLKVQEREVEREREIESNKIKYTFRYKWNKTSNAYCIKIANSLRFANHSSSNYAPFEQQRNISCISRSHYCAYHLIKL